MPEPDLLKQLELERQSLLDLTLRNRMINTPQGRGPTTRLEVIEEKSAEIFKILVRQKKEMSFLSREDSAEEDVAEEESVDERIVVGREESSEGESQEGHAYQCPFCQCVQNLPVADLSPGELFECCDCGELFDVDLQAAGPDSGAVPESELEDEDEDEAFRQPDEGDARYTDLELQTSLDDEKLQKRLLKLSYEAKTVTEEQGINCLYLALGFLEWYDSPASERAVYAPLVLVPVGLDRQTVNARFRVHFYEEDIVTNLSLQRKLKDDFGIELPEIPGDIDDFSLHEYMSRVAEVTSGQPRWRVHEDKITLWFFSFAKYRMFRDLDPEQWPSGCGPADHKTIRGLLGESAEWEPPLFDEDSRLDDRLSPGNLCHVVDCDSSQAAAIEEARQGRNLVIQGPPGTGKSQSISNIIAAAVRDEKTVLFVSEKMAALQVVKSRLDEVGLGGSCLELHSHKANRTTVLEDLEQTLAADRGNLPIQNGGSEIARVQKQLNDYVEELHAPLEQYGLTPYQLIGKISRLHAKGTERLPFDVPGLNQLVFADFSAKKDLLKNVIEESAQVAANGRSIWFGVEKTEYLLPSDVKVLQHELDGAVNSFNALLEAAEELHASLGLSFTEGKFSCNRLENLCAAVDYLLLMPPLDGQAFAHPLWGERREDIRRAVKAGREAEELREDLGQVFAEGIWNSDFDDLVDSVERLGLSGLRWFRREWWQVRRQVRAFAGKAFPRNVRRQLDALKQVQAWKRIAVTLQADQDLGRLGTAVFGSLWKGVESDWKALKKIAAWEADCATHGLAEGFRQIVHTWKDRDRTRNALDVLKSALESARSQGEKICSLLMVDSGKAFGEDVLRVSVVTLREVFEAWQTGTETLGAWQGLQRRLSQLEEVGLGPLVSSLERGEVDQSAHQRLELMYCEFAIRHAFNSRHALANFSGLEQDGHVKRFRQLDRERIVHARAVARGVHLANIPEDGGTHRLGVVREEIRKRRRRRTLRKLLADAGNTVTKIKPVFMMSPMSVAQYLTPGKMTFDLLVIDEASQVSPVQAFGAIARSKQVVVVGDNKQLPPTSFFDRVGGDDDTQEYDALAGDMESILDLCVAKNVPQRMLRWHYRSRHHSLIAVSNNAFYGDRLFVVPSAARQVSDQGVSLRFVEDGLYERGGSRRNRPEAQAVAKAMIAHAKKTPHLSLGVAAFSTAQRDVVLDELELLRRNHPETEPFFSSTKEDAWFVKNLENIQGDERDVIFISVGYGPDRSGVVSMNFGPVTAFGGERRLNVLISRAKHRCVVFSSIRADDIDLQRTNSVGVQVLKKYLHFAETGRLEVNHAGGEEYDSEFEAQVADVLKEAGWTVESQVGIAGFRIDLAVVDPNCPGRYLVGIECDGARYHSARWARDRDRLRQQVLEDHGWEIYRIWSTDWFISREQQVRKLLAKLEDLAAASRGGVTDEGNALEPGAVENQVKESQPVVVPEATVESEVLVQVSCPSCDMPQAVPSAGGAEGEQYVCSSCGKEYESDTAEELGVEEDLEEEESSGTEVANDSAYVEAKFYDPLMQTELLRVPNRDLAEIVYRVIEVESPIHQDEVVQRIRTLWGYARAGDPITNKVKTAIRAARRKWSLAAVGKCICLPNQTEFPPRSRENVKSNSLRDADRLPPMEIDEAITRVLERHGALEENDLMTEVTRMFGFRRMGPQIRAVIEGRLERLLSEDKIVSRGGDLMLQG